MSNNRNETLNAKKFVRPKKILVVGQVPPPFGGQAIAIKRLLDTNFPDIKFLFIRLSNSNSMGEVGKFKIKKIVYTIYLICKIIFFRIFHRVSVLYYPPAPSNRGALFRDMFLIIPARVIFPKVIFHFHAAGIKEAYESLVFLKVLFRRCYFHPDLAIYISNYAAQEIRFLRPARMVYIPNGLPDYLRGSMLNRNDKNEDPVILYVGALYPSKGIFDLLQALEILDAQGIRFQARIVGEGEPKIVERISAFIKQKSLSQKVHLLGVLTGEPKWMEFSRADIFCFPTFFEAENLPLVLIEAMIFNLPIVATNWRGIPDLVKDGQNGFLVPIRSPHKIAEKLKHLLLSKKLRYEMGKAGRAHYESNFTSEMEIEKIHKALLSLFE